MHIIVHNTVAHLAHFYNKIEHYWEGDKNHRLLGSFIVMTFFLSLLAIGAKKAGWIPQSIAPYIPDSYISAIVWSFIVLLAFEVFSLIFTLPGSVSSSMTKQFEIFSLILLRDAFKEIDRIIQPDSWHNAAQSFIGIGSHIGGALVIFIGIYLIKSLQLHLKITPDKHKQNQFVEIKKVISLVLIVVFIILGIQDVVLFFTHADTFKFFQLFYTILIFVDVLIVLIALRYNYSYTILFRNSGFAVGTILLRLSLTTEGYYGIIIAISSVAFILALTYFYSKFRLKEQDFKARIASGDE